MSFRVIPWQLYVLIVVVAALATLVYAKKFRKDFPTTFIAGLVLVSFGGICASILRYVDNNLILNGHIRLLQIITTILVSLGIPFILFGAYVKVKDDTERRRVMLILIWTLLGVVGLISVIVVNKLVFKN